MPLRARMYIGSSVTSWPSSIDAARVGRRQADGHVERRRLAGAVRAEQADDLARRDVEVDAAHDRAAAVGLGRGRCVRSVAISGRVSQALALRTLPLPPFVCVRICSLPSTTILSVGLEEGQRPAGRLAAALVDDRHRRAGHDVALVGGGVGQPRCRSSCGSARAASRSRRTPRRARARRPTASGTARSCRAVMSPSGPLRCASPV